jgi:AmmeMemoRadiSam system protein B
LQQEDFIRLIKKSLTKNLSQLFENCKKSPSNWNVRAIISPHAGYQSFQGKLLRQHFQLYQGNGIYKNIFIIGSSHVMYFDGASVYNCGDYITPLGKVPVNKEIANKLISNNKVFQFPINAHITGT